jgi:hypothetical protein
MSKATNVAIYGSASAVSVALMIPAVILFSLFIVGLVVIAKFI